MFPTLITLLRRRSQSAEKNLYIFGRIVVHLYMTEMQNGNISQPHSRLLALCMCVKCVLCCGMACLCKIQQSEGRINQKDSGQSPDNHPIEKDLAPIDLRMNVAKAVLQWTAARLGRTITWKDATFILFNKKLKHAEAAL